MRRLQYHRDHNEFGELSVLRYKERIQSVVAAETLRALLEHRRQAERSGMGPKMITGEPVSTFDGGLAIARYDGMDVGANHRFATLIIVSGRGAWAFFLEGAPTAEGAFRNRAKALFDGITVAQ